MRTNVIIIVASLIIIVIIAAFMVQYHAQPSNDNAENGTDQSGDIEMMEQYENKIVYTTDVGQDAEPFVNDCRDRGGEFSECGSVCAPDAEVCTEQCAYTCALDETDSRQ